jgi:hypothetical protein
MAVILVQRQMRVLGSFGDAALIDYLQEQLQIVEVVGLIVMFF